ncbi:hypothetical protein [Microbacterium sp.]|uniref:hypothetical protein n=1 Tax=Microbacterium sp. TaxID=51671 RepID=UPI0028113F36|nr:hypothetical protein [Microbacterium sp.]
MSDGTDDPDRMATPEGEQEAPATDEPSAEQPTDEQPGVSELEEPSTEKEPGEEPTAARPHDPEPDHQAVGIGVVGGPQTDTGQDEADRNGGEPQ